MEPQKSETFHRLRRQSKLRVMLVFQTLRLCYAPVLTMVRVELYFKGNQ